MARHYRRISADSHVEVPPDEWARGVPEKYRGLAPRRIQLPDGGDGFVVEGGIYRGGVNLYAGKRPEDFRPIGLKWDEMAGTGDSAQRLREMDADAVDAEVLYPGVGGVRGTCRGIKDDEAYLALTRTYNRWQVEEYCSADPDRLIGVGCIPERGLDAALDELHWCKEAGMKVVEIASFPSGSNYPTPEDDRFWAAAIDMDMPVTVHTSFRTGVANRGPVFKYPIEPSAAVRPPDYVQRLARYGIRGALNVVQLVMSGLFDRFPTLQIYFAENQLGWIPCYLEQMDHSYHRHRFWAEELYGMKPLKRLPAEYIKEHIIWGFFDDPVGIKLRHEIGGADRIMWGGDFPHVESEWPHSAELLERLFQGVPEEEQYQITVGNAVKFFHLQQSA